MLLAYLIALVAVGEAAWISVYVFGEDSYTADGRNRWETHNAATHHAVYVVVLLVLASLTIGAFVSRRSGSLVRALGVLTAVVVAVIWYAVVLAFDNN